MKSQLLFAAALAFATIACSPATPPTAEKNAGAACGKDDARLAVTGFCQAEAAQRIAPARLTPISGALPEGCAYVIGETATPDADEAILYRALSCKGKTTALEFSAGARSASLGRAASGFFESVPAAGDEGWEVVRLFRLEGVSDPKKLILDMAKGTAKEEKAKAAEIAACEVRPAGAGYPADAVLVDVNDAYKRANRIGPYDPVKDGPGAGEYAACGSWGITDASGDFWLIRDGYAWFVQQGQDLPDFDAGSLTVFRKGANGWAPVG